MFSDNDYIIIKDRVFTYGNDKIAKEHCLRKDKYFIRLSMNGNVSNKDAYFVRYYCVKSRNDFISNLDKFNKNLPKDFYNKTRDRHLKKKKFLVLMCQELLLKSFSTPLNFFLIIFNTFKQ